MFESPEVTVSSLDRLSRLVSQSGEPCLLLIEECQAMYASLPPEDHDVWSSTNDEDLEELFSAIEFFVDSCAEVGIEEDDLCLTISN